MGPTNVACMKTQASMYSGLQIYAYGVLTTAYPYSAKSGSTNHKRGILDLKNRKAKRPNTKKEANQANMPA